MEQHSTTHYENVQREVVRRLYEVEQVERIYHRGPDAKGLLVVANQLTDEAMDALIRIQWWVMDLLGELMDVEIVDRRGRPLEWRYDAVELGPVLNY